LGNKYSNIGLKKEVRVMAKLAAAEVAALDPYKFMAVIGKTVIHPGGRASTRALLARAGITATGKVLDVGCGVATTAVEIAGRYGAQLAAVDIAPLMPERAEANVRAAKMTGRVTVQPGDICALPFADDSFDIVVAEAVTMFADRRRSASELARVCVPGGQVLATEFCWRTQPPAQARQVFLGQGWRQGPGRWQGRRPDTRLRKPGRCL
jgi:SAM-dependent methyltransferase